MPVLSKGTTFANGSEASSTNLNNLVDNATFASGAVDDSTTQLSSGAIIVKDLGIATGKLADLAVTPAKISTGGPSWDVNGNTVINGVNTNSSAAAGVVGEYKSTTLASSSAFDITSATATNITSVSLTAGDWDVSGVIFYDANGACLIELGPVYAAISSTSATLPGANSGAQAYVRSVAGNGYDYCSQTPIVRMSLASTTTVYLIGQCEHNASPSVSVYGTIRARRVR